MTEFEEKTRDYAKAQELVIAEARALIEDLKRGAQHAARGDRDTPIRMLNDRHRRIRTAIEQLDSIKLFGEGAGK